MNYHWTATDLAGVWWRGFEDLGLHVRGKRGINGTNDQLFDCRSEFPGSFGQRLLSRLDLLLTREENEDIAERLSHVDLKHGNNHSVDVISLGRLRVSDGEREKWWDISSADSVCFLGV